MILPIPVVKFAFDIAYKDLPTTLGIDIIIDEITYHYEFSVFNQMVVFHKKIQLNNCTEVHWRFTDIFNPEPSTKVAFESDIHSTGFNREIETIKIIEIKHSNKIEEKYVDYKNEIQKQPKTTIFSKIKKILTFKK